MEIKSQPKYYVAFFTTKFKSIDEVMAQMPDALASHVSRSNALHREGKVLMAGALRSDPGQNVTTVGLFYSRQDAEEFAKGDPFVLAGKISEVRITEWNNILKDI